MPEHRGSGIRNPEAREQLPSTEAREYAIPRLGNDNPILTALRGSEFANTEPRGLSNRFPEPRKQSRGSVPDCGLVPSRSRGSAYHCVCFAQMRLVHLPYMLQQIQR